MGAHRQNFAIALVSGFPVIAATVVGLRFLARSRRGIRFALDDWLLVFATVFSFGLIGPTVLDIRLFHRGYHVWEYPTTSKELHNWDYGLYYGILLSFNLLSIPILPLSKASMLLLLLRVGRVLVSIHRFLYAIFVFNALSAVIPWALYIFICPPGTGHSSAPTTFGDLQCLNNEAQGKLLLFVNCANLATDLLVFPVPFFIMCELMNTNWRSKLTILLTFASSLCVTALSALKIHVTYRDRIALADSPDWMFSLEFCITHAEAVVGIIVACIPTLRGLITPNFETTTFDTRLPSFVYSSPPTGDFRRSQTSMPVYFDRGLQVVTPMSKTEGNEAS